jgi:pimeloyl-ACP methyl ester carboxylesterase
VAWVASQNPEAVGGIVIAAGSLDPGQERIHPLQHLGEMWPVRPLLPRTIRNANQELMELKPWLEQLQPMLSRICTRVLIIHGTEDDLVPYENVDFMQRHLTAAAQVSVDRLEGVNHFLPWNSKDRIEAAIQTLVQKCDAGC